MNTKLVGNFLAEQMERCTSSAVANEQLSRIHRQSLPSTLWGTVRNLLSIYCMYMYLYMYKIVLQLPIHVVSNAHSHEQWSLVYWITAMSSLPLTTIFALLGSLCSGHKFTCCNHQKHWECHHRLRMGPWMDNSWDTFCSHGQEYRCCRQWTFWTCSCSST